MKTLKTEEILAICEVAKKEFTWRAQKDKCDEVARLAIAMSSSDPWKPILTAPQDGTHIDLWVVMRPGTPRDYFKYKGYTTERRATDCWAHIDSQGELYWFYNRGAYIHSVTSNEEIVTHWMPKPSAPKE